MNKKDRRYFIKQCTTLGICCIGPFTFGKSFASSIKFDDDKPDPKNLNYCGYKCPDDCKMLKATLGGNVELKKEAYDLWKIKEKYGVDFDPDKVFCYKCKNNEKPQGIVIKNCTVRSCAIEKGYDCCIECPDLINCDKKLWDQFKEFHESVIKMQEKYMAETK